MSRTDAASEPDADGTNNDSSEMHLFHSGDADIVDTWLTLLEPAEKLHVLSLDVRDLREFVAELADNSSADVADQVSRIVSDAAFMSAIRLAFVDSLYNEGRVSLTSLRDNLAAIHQRKSEPGNQRVNDLVIHCVLSIFETQLIQFHTRHHAVTRLLVYQIFLLLRVMAFTRLLRWPLSLLLVAVTYVYANTGSLKHSIKATHSDSSLARLLPALQYYADYLLLPFEPLMQSVAHYNFTLLTKKIDALYTAVLLVLYYSSIDTVSTKYYIVAVLSLLSFALTVAQSFLSSTQAKLVHYFQLLLSFFLSFLLVYCTYQRSLVDSLFFAILLLPTLLVFVVSSLSIVVTTALTLLIYAQSYAHDPNNRFYTKMAVWLVSLAYSLWYRATSSWLDYIVNWTVVIALLPQSLSQLVMMAATSLSSTILAMGLTKLVVSVTEIVLLVSLAVLLLLLVYLLPLVAKLLQPIVTKLRSNRYSGAVIARVLAISQSLYNRYKAPLMAFSPLLVSLVSKLSAWRFGQPQSQSASDDR